jgi:CO dehydrogenase maturation factor
VLKNIDVLLIVSDMSARSLETAGGIARVAEKQDGEISVKRTGLILNRVRGDEISETTGTTELAEKTGLEILGQIPEDKTLNDYDREGKSLLGLPDDSPCLGAVRDILAELKI